MTLESSAPAMPASTPATSVVAEAGQTPAPQAETPKPAASEDRDFEVEWSRRFNELTRRERKILEEARKAKEAMARVSEWEEKRKSAKQNPLEWLKENGLTYEEITNFLLNDGKVSPEDRITALESTIAQERQAREEERRQLEAQREQEIEQTFRRNVADFVSANPEYELTAKQGETGVDLIYQVMETYHDKSGGKMMRIEDAAKEVEAYLEKELEKIIKSTKKVTKFIPALEKPASDNEERVSDANRPRDGISTLTHQAVTSLPATPAGDDAGLLPEEESKRRAADLIRKLQAQQR